MYIKSLKIKNFKSIKDLEIDFAVPDWKTPGSGLNIFVWENNSWKTSLMEAMYFIRNKSNKDIKKIWTEPNDDYYIEQTFGWSDLEEVIDSFVQENKKEVFKKCIDKNMLTVRREFKTPDDIKKILFLDNQKFSNKSGIDAWFLAFYQISNIWADTNPENESKFWSSTICWNLLADISDEFKVNNKEYDEFIAKFNSIFNDNKSWLQADLNSLAEETQSILKEQFWSASLKFKFENPEPNVLFKNIKILVNDWEETDISEKWHWLQRAIILSLLQVYAKRITKKTNWNNKSKPHFLFIDEPELWLHPQAQKKLFQALKILSTSNQIFISTHSENFISLDSIKNIHKFIKNSWNISIYSCSKINSLNLIENRSFFFHHHKLFFDKKAIFVEWSDDINNYPIFADTNGLSWLKNSFYLMQWCANHKNFRELCNNLGIDSCFILDLDIIWVNSNAKKWFLDSIRDKILKLNIKCSKKNPNNLLDENLNNNQIISKKEIIEDLKKEWYFILSEWAYEQYFTWQWEISDTNKKNEIIKILEEIKDFKRKN